MLQRVIEKPLTVNLTAYMKFVWVFFIVTRDYHLKGQWNVSEPPLILYEIQSSPVKIGEKDQCFAALLDGHSVHRSTNLPVLTQFWEAFKKFKFT